MSHKETESVCCSCEKLGGTAQIELGYLYHPSGFRALDDFKCNQAKDCGVGRQISPYSWDFDFNNCPVRQILKKKK